MPTRPKPALPAIRTTTSAASRPTPGSRPTAAKKNFTPIRWDSAGVGEKIIINGRSGRGKTSLAAMLPNAAFMGIDAGGKNIRHPETGEKLMMIPGVEDFDDVRSAIRAMCDTDYKFIVVDTINVVEKLGTPWTLQHVPMEKGAVAQNLESYGFGKGYRHLFDTMNLPLLDFDRLIEAGKHVVLLSQPADNKIANASGDDYLCHGLGLMHSPRFSVANLYTEWADHIFKVDYQDIRVKKENKLGKGKATGSQQRVIYTDGAVHYVAKSRQLPNGEFMPPVVSFENRTDDSVWRFMFPELY